MERGHAAPTRDAVPLVILSLAAGHVALGGWQLIAPDSFFDTLGPFGESNPHYTRDVGTFTLALGVAFALAYRQAAWRIGVVGYALFQYVFHAINHLVDIGDADPEALGPIDFVSLTLTAGVLGWLLAQVLRRRGEAVP